MKSILSDIRIPLALLLICIGLQLRQNENDWKFPNFHPFGVGNVVIIEETKDRASLPASQVAIITSTTLPGAIQSLGGNYLGCFDQDIVDKDKKPPTDLAPYLDAAKKLNKLPALVYDGWFGVKVIPLPVDEKTVLEVL